VKLLIDQNLSFRLVSTLLHEFSDSAHVRDVQFERASDRDVWEFAGRDGFRILTKDSDFSHLSFLYGPPPKVIWLTIGNSKPKRPRRSSFCPEPGVSTAAQAPPS